MHRKIGVGIGFLAAREHCASEAEILAEAGDLVHSLVQDRHDADVAVRQSSPIDEMPFVTEEITVNAELGRNGSRGNLVGSDPVERFERAGDLAVRLFGSPVARV